MIKCCYELPASLQWMGIGFVFFSLYKCLQQAERIGMASSRPTNLTLSIKTKILKENQSTRANYWLFFYIVGVWKASQLPLGEKHGLFRVPLNCILMRHRTLWKHVPFSQMHHWRAHMHTVLSPENISPKEKQTSLLQTVSLNQRL